VEKIQWEPWSSASAGKGSDMSELRNCAKRFGASRSRLCPGGPRVHLSDPAYMPSCIRPEVRLLLDHRVLGSDCCIKLQYVWPRCLLLFCTA